MASKGEEARQRILLQATRLIATRGYQDTSIQSVADAVGLSQSAVLYHYPSKRALFAGILRFIVARNDAIRAELTPPPEAGARERLMAHFEANYRWGVEADHHAQIMSCLLHLATVDGDFADEYAGILSEARQKILTHIHAGIREGVFQSVSDPALDAEILHDALLGFVLTSITTGKVVAKSRLRARWERLVDELLRYRPRPS